MLSKQLFNAILWLLCIGAVAFPFSVAVTNAAFGAAIGASLFSGHLLKGICIIWNQYRPLLLAIAAYLLLMLLGLLWSQDISYGFKVVSHQWLWLLLPMLVAISLDHAVRNRLLLSLSIGLSLHLAYCVLQYNGLVSPPNVGGSHIHDATGYIGHIAFGFVYAIWGGWLIELGITRAGWQRWGYWLLATWAFSMIFLAQGRSGYLVAIAVLAILLTRHVVSEFGWKRFMLVGALLTITLMIIAIGPAKERIQKTWDSAVAAYQGDLQHAEERWIIWLVTLKALESSPVVGVGTGGFPSAYKTVIKNSPELIKRAKRKYHHPHNIYLQALVRWGVPGGIAILVLIAMWLRIGWAIKMDKKPEASLILLSGIAVLVHGLSTVSLEEHFPTVMAIIMLGIGLSSDQNEKEKMSHGN